MKERSYSFIKSIIEKEIPNAELGKTANTILRTLSKKLVNNKENIRIKIKTVRASNGRIIDVIDIEGLPDKVRLARNRSYKGGRIISGGVKYEGHSEVDISETKVLILNAFHFNSDNNTCI